VLNEPHRKYLSLKEAATLSGRSYWQIRESVLNGDLAATQFKPGGKFYITPAALDALFASHMVSPLSNLKAGSA
jgi:hypothetical protein